MYSVEDPETLLLGLKGILEKAEFKVELSPEAYKVIAFAYQNRCIVHM